ncbi:MAG TPA: radical SAM protein [Gemmatimonadales bacterium]
MWMGSLRMTIWPELDRRQRGTSFIGIEAKSIVNASAATQMIFASVNPYIGCEFGCAYCYARDTHRWTVERATQRDDAAEVVREISALPPATAFERRILVKQNAAALLATTLHPSRLRGDPLVIGTATDPYQPAERIFRITRSLLEVLLQYHDLRLGVITKSPLIARDAALLAQLSERHKVTVSLSLGSIDAPLLRRLEPRTPAPHARLRAMRTLVAAGVRVGLLIAPILPGITDDRAALRALIVAAKDAGAAWVAGSPLRMGPATRATLIPWLLRERPDLAARYQRHYGDRHWVARSYADALHRRLVDLQTELGIVPEEGSREKRNFSRTRRPPDQLDLWTAVRDQTARMSSAQT